MEQEKESEVHGEAQQPAHIDLLLKRYERDGDRLPENRDYPEFNGQSLQSVARDERIGKRACAGAKDKSEKTVDNEGDRARAELKCACAGAKAVGKDSRAHGYQRGILCPG